MTSRATTCHARPPVRATRRDFVCCLRGTEEWSPTGVTFAPLRVAYAALDDISPNVKYVNTCAAILVD